jgi:hypothetical protein
MAELMDTYADLPLGTVAAAERLGITKIATLDRRHFTVVRPTFPRPASPGFVNRLSIRGNDEVGTRLVS